MLLHCAKPGDSGTYRMTITNSSGTASCSASLSIRSESKILFLLMLNESFPPRKDDLVHTNANPISPFCAEESLLQSGQVQLDVLLLLGQLLLLLLLLLLQHLLLLRQTLCSLYFLPLLPLATLYCYSCYLNKAMLTIKTTHKDSCGIIDVMGVFSLCLK